jgi:hypothetical protein
LSWVIFGRKIGHFCVRNPNTEFLNFNYVYLTMAQLLAYQRQAQARLLA